MANLEEKLDALTLMSSAHLRQHWQKVTARVVPKISDDMLRLALAYEIQVKALGGLSRTTQQKLAQLATAKTRTSAVLPGMRLVREWNGKAYIVTIDDDGIIRWRDREWRSLSEVAREITGTRWSGPAFFGLKQRVAA